MGSVHLTFPFLHVKSRLSEAWEKLAKWCRGAEEDLRSLAGVEHQDWLQTLLPRMHGPFSRGLTEGAKRRKEGRPHLELWINMSSEEPGDHSSGSFQMWSIELKDQVTPRLPPIPESLRLSPSRAFQNAPESTCPVSSSASPRLGQMTLCTGWGPQASVLIRKPLQ